MRLGGDAYKCIPQFEEYKKVQSIRYKVQGGTKEEKRRYIRLLLIYLYVAYYWKIT